MNKKGVTLAELIISVGMAGIIMVGMSVFFSSSVKNSFEAQEKANVTRGQFTVNAIIAKKFASLGAVTEIGNHLIAVSGSASEPPFTYIGKDAENHLVFKDFFAFNKIIQNSGNNNIYGNSGEGKITQPAVDAPNVTGLPLNFAGFALNTDENAYYITLPNQNKIILCDEGNCAIPDVIYENGLSSPMDVTLDENGENLFISDSGNNRILKVDMMTGALQGTLTGSLNFPTGLAYHKYDEANEFLFVADTGNGLIKRFNVANPAEEPFIVTGLGSQTDCDGSAKYCKLNRPTGLFFGGIPGAPPGENGLFIADSGNNRILLVSDPGHPDFPDGNPLEIAVNIGDAEPIKRLVISLPAGMTTTSTTRPEVSDATNLPDIDSLFAVSANTIEYRLFTTLNQDTPVTNSCGAPGCLVNQKISVTEGNLFRNSDLIKLDNDTFHSAEPPAYLQITNSSNPYQLNPNFNEDHWVDEEVMLANGISNGRIVFHIYNLDTTGVTGDPYPLIKIEAYGLEDNLVPELTRYASLRIGDGVVGNNNDVIREIATPEHILRFPTGISNTYVANTGGTGASELKKIADGTEFSLIPFSLTADADAVFDYVSDFELAATNGLEVSLTGSLLEMVIETADGKTYKINKHIE